MMRDSISAMLAGLQIRPSGQLTYPGKITVKKAVVVSGNTTFKNNVSGITGWHIGACIFSNL